jgi:hypothetical protein
MRLTLCVACGSTDDLQHHHLITRLENGSDDETNLITLCNGCHAKLHERRLNSIYKHRQSTIAGLAAAKARGVTLGNPNLAEAQSKAAVIAQAEANRFATSMRSILDSLGDISANAMARELNARHVTTARGGKWSASTVLRVQRRLEAVS